MQPPAANLRALLGFPFVALGLAWIVGSSLDSLPMGPPEAQGAAPPLTVDFPADGTRLELITPVAAAPGVEVRPLPAAASATGAAMPAPALMGRVEVRADRLVFFPALPFIPGQGYEVAWTTAEGRRQRAEFTLNAPAASAPTVRLEPADAPLPANALKLYLHFSQPMEQGVFLDRLRLVDAAGQEVVGPFRETELWSPDGRRLTLWLHPGRQKTGVNLNVDEGPVLRAGGAYTLQVAAGWRSTAGAPLGAQTSFALRAGPADHACPQMAAWQVHPPAGGGRAPLHVVFDEPLDSAMLATALRVYRPGAAAPLALEVTVESSGRAWSAVPAAPWEPGGYELRADPLLEDLAGNNLDHPFEVDLSAAPLPKTPAAQGESRHLRVFSVR